MGVRIPRALGPPNREPRKGGRGLFHNGTLGSRVGLPTGQSPTPKPVKNLYTKSSSPLTTSIVARVIRLGHFTQRQITHLYQNGTCSIPIHSALSRGASSITHSLLTDRPVTYHFLSPLPQIVAPWLLSRPKCHLGVSPTNPFVSNHFAPLAPLGTDPAIVPCESRQSREGREAGSGEAVASRGV